MKKHLNLFLLLILLIFSKGKDAYSQNCQPATLICNGGAFMMFPNSGTGLSTTLSVSNPTNNPFPPNSGCIFGGGANPNWLIITVTNSGLLGFSLGDGNGPNPQVAFYDWVLWPYSQNACNSIYNNTLPPVACNWNSSPYGGTGMGQIPQGGDWGNFETSFPVTAGQQFILFVNNYSSVTTLVTFSSTGTAGLDCIPEIVTCGNTTKTYTINSSLSNASYTLDPGGIIQSSPVFTLSSPTTQIYTVTISGSPQTSTQVITYMTTLTYSVEALPAIIVSNPLYLCANPPISFTVNPGGNYNMVLQGMNGFTNLYTTNTITLHNFNSSNNGNYTLTTLSPLGCSNITTTLDLNISSVSSIEIDSVPRVCKGETFFLNASIPIQGSYVWSGPGFYYAYQKNNTIDSATLSQSGIYKVKVYFLNGPKQCQLTNTVSVNVEDCTGLSEIEYRNLKIWPNPTQGAIYISGQNDITHVEIIDFAGRIIKMTLKENKGDLSFLQDGVYLVRLFSKDKISSEKRILILK